MVTFSDKENFYIYLLTILVFFPSECVDDAANNDVVISVFLVNGESVLLVAFVKFTLSKLYSYCTQNCNFNYLLVTKICFVTKNCSTFS